jgi:hypothetical protein
MTVRLQGNAMEALQEGAEKKTLIGIIPNPMICFWLLL